MRLPLAHFSYIYTRQQSDSFFWRGGLGQEEGLQLLQHLKDLSFILDSHCLVFLSTKFEEELLPTEFPQPFDSELQSSSHLLNQFFLLVPPDLFPNIVPSDIAPISKDDSLRFQDSEGELAKIKKGRGFEA